EGARLPDDARLRRSLDHGAGAQPFRARGRRRVGEGRRAARGVSMSGVAQAHEVDPVVLAKAGPFGRAMLEIGERRPDVVALSADVAGVTGLAPFAQAFPDRVVNVGMAEENLISVAVGLAKAGFTPVATTFAVFATRRALDFIAIQVALNGANVKIVAALPG